MPLVLVASTIDSRRCPSYLVAENVSNGKWREAVDQLASCGVQLDVGSYSALLRHCGEAKDLTRGKRVHAQIAKLGYDRETSTGNEVVQMYGKCGSTEHARRAFNGIREPNVISWNIVISAFARNGQLEDAREMFHNMPVKSIASWNSMVTGLSQNGSLQEAFELFESMKERDVVSWNAIITALAQNRQSMQALKMVRRMDLEGLKGDSFTFVSSLQACIDLEMLPLGRAVHAKIKEAGNEETPVCNALITMYAKCGSLESAVTVFESMKCRDVRTNTSMLAAYAHYGFLEKARQIFDQIPPSQKDKNVVPWNAMIAGYAQNGEGNQALQVFQLMDLEGVKANEVTFVSTVDACALSTLVAPGKVVSSRAMEKCFHKTNVIVGNALIHFYGKCGLVQQGKLVFEQMTKRDESTYNALIGAFVHSGHSDGALEHFHLMIQDSVKPSDITFCSVLSACGQAGEVQNGRDYFVSMKLDFELVPRVAHYNCMIDVLGRTGQLDAAKSLIESMPLEPEASTWRTFLGACRVHGSKENARQAAERTSELDGGDSAPYSLLSNVMSD